MPGYTGLGRSTQRPQGQEEPVDKEKQREGTSRDGVLTVNLHRRVVAFGGEHTQGHKQGVSLRELSTGRRKALGFSLLLSCCFSFSTAQSKPEPMVACHQSLGGKLVFQVRKGDFPDLIIFLQAPVY